MDWPVPNIPRKNGQRLGTRKLWTFSVAPLSTPSRPQPPTHYSYQRSLVHLDVWPEFFLGQSISLREVKGHQSLPCSISHTLVSKGRGKKEILLDFRMNISMLSWFWRSRHIQTLPWTSKHEMVFNPNGQIHFPWIWQLFLGRKFLVSPRAKGAADTEVTV